MKTPSYWLRKPRPSAAPRLARAGKHAAHPMAVTIEPMTPALSAARVRGFWMGIGMASATSVEPSERSCGHVHSLPLRAEDR